MTIGREAIYKLFFAGVICKSDIRSLLSFHVNCEIKLDIQKKMYAVAQEKYILNFSFECRDNAS